MTKFAFFSIPLHAHINPTLPIVQELVARGDEVVYYLTEQYKGAIEATGATFHSYKSKLEQRGENAQYTSQSPNLPLFMVDECLFVIPQILESVRAEQPDCIIYDPMCLSGRFIAQLLHIPAAISRPTFASHKKVLQSHQARGNGGMSEAMKIFQSSMQQLCALYSISPFQVADIFLHKEDLNIIYLPRSFQIDGESFEKEYVFVGPSIGPRCESADFPFDQLGTEPIVYITLGTVYNNNPAFFNACLAAFKDQPLQVIIATGRPVEHLHLNPIPDNFLVRSYVPQLDILKYVDVFVGHGGMMTIMESISRGVPMMAIPQVTTQEENARRVADLEIGIMLEKDAVNAESLLGGVKKILGNSMYRTRAQQLQAEALAAGGFKAAADALQDFAKIPVRS